MSDSLLTIREDYPDALLDCDATGVEAVLGGPTLIHLPGRREAPLFVSVLLHGNEYTGLQAVQSVLRKYRGRELPRSLSVFIGNVSAATHGQRRLDGQPDYNRVWPGCDAIGSPEHRMMQQLVDQMRERKVFASIDVHNNTGLNPHYACINILDHRFYHLATMFSRTVVYFTRPLGVQSAAFAELCPAVTVECGQAGQDYSEEHAAEFIDACLNLAEHPGHEIAEHDIDLFHTVAIVRVSEEVSFGFETHGTDLVFEKDLDHMNFRELTIGTRIGRVWDGDIHGLQAWNNDGRNVVDDYFELEEGNILLKRAVMPSMLTLDERVIRQDCLCYLMERFDYRAS
jgi:succinylglutamate desuccinylase